MMVIFSSSQDKLSLVVVEVNLFILMRYLALVVRMHCLLVPVLQLELTTVDTVKMPGYSAFQVYTYSHSLFVSVFLILVLGMQKKHLLNVIPFQAFSASKAIVEIERYSFYSLL